ncbi:MAG: tol-pal system YbgF family protein [Rhodothermales bacterium]
MTRHILQWLHKLGFIGLLASVLFLVAPPEGWAQPRDKCTQEWTAAETHYLEGRFDDAIRLLQTCLDRETLFIQEAVKVYRLLTLAHLNKGDMEQARLSLRSLLKVVPDYTADPVQDPPTYTTLVDLVKEEIQQEVLAATPVEEEEPREELEVQPEDLTDPDEEETIPPVVVPIEQPAQPKKGKRTPKSWLLGTGGAIVLVTAAVLAFGGGGN